MKLILKKFANTLTVGATLFMVVGLAYTIVKGQPLSDLVADISLCYVVIAAFNYIVFGSATLWHMKVDE